MLKNFLWDDEECKSAEVPQHSSNQFFNGFLNAKAYADVQ